MIGRRRTIASRSLSGLLPLPLLFVLMLTVRAIVFIRVFIEWYKLWRSRSYNLYIFTITVSVQSPSSDKSPKRTQAISLFACEQQVRIGVDPAGNYASSIYLSNSQLVTASFQTLTSCILVPPKCSTNASPNTSLATLPSLIILFVASSKLTANLTTFASSPCCC